MDDAGRHWSELSLFSSSLRLNTLKANYAIVVQEYTILSMTIYKNKINYRQIKQRIPFLLS